MTGALACFQTEAQTITAPVGTPLTITNSVDVTLATGNVNVPADGSFNIGTKKIVSAKGTQNLMIGENAGNSVTTGSGNLYFGPSAGANNTIGTDNVFIGGSAGGNGATGFSNTFIGGFAGFKNNGGINNLFIGTAAGRENLTGSDNIMLGTNAGRLSTGNSNTFIGAACGYNNQGQNNLFIAAAAGQNNSTGEGNTFLGVSAGRFHTTGNDNTYLGVGTNSPTTGISNSTAIGAYASVSASNSLILGSTSVNVGIGNSAPTAKLEITAAGGSGLKFTNLTSGSAATATGGSNKVLSVDGSGNVILVALAGAVTTTSVEQPVSDNWKEADGYLYNNSTNGVVIKGTGLDGNSLIVKGGVLSKEVNVKVEGSESWPDYVFQPSYKRMSLDEVEKFITVNKHLPNVPSAAEMAVTGNNLGKTDVKLLEKVEELTLYLLEMKKTNDAQSAELKALKQQVSKLRKK
jgi:trimeric autotransporter adhesin